MKEYTFHCAVADYLHRALPADHIWWHTNNTVAGTRNDRRRGAMLKRMGVRPGVPDIIVARPYGKIVYIELKTAKGTPNDNQKIFRDWCRANHCSYYVCRSVDEVQLALEDSGVALRAKVA